MVFVQIMLHENSSLRLEIEDKMIISLRLGIYFYQISTHLFLAVNLQNLFGKQVAANRVECCGLEA